MTGASMHSMHSLRYAPPLEGPLAARPWTPAMLRRRAALVFATPATLIFLLLLVTSAWRARGYLSLIWSMPSMVWGDAPKALPFIGQWAVIGALTAPSVSRARQWYWLLVGTTVAAIGAVSTWLMVEAFSFVREGHSLPMDRAAFAVAVLTGLMVLPCLIAGAVLRGWAGRSGGVAP